MTKTMKNAGKRIKHIRSMFRAKACRNFFSSKGLKPLLSVLACRGCRGDGVGLGGGWLVVTRMLIIGI